MRRMGVAACVALATIVFGAVTQAQAQGLPRQWRWCGNDDSQQSLDACDAIIDSGRRTQNNRSLAEAYTNRGNIYADTGKMRQAIDDYTQAIKLDPTHDDVFAARGELYYELREYKLALADFDAATRLNPNDAVDWAWRSRVEGHLGNADGANADLAHAHELDPQVENYVPND